MIFKICIKIKKQKKNNNKKKEKGRKTMKRNLKTQIFGTIRIRKNRMGYVRRIRACVRVNVVEGHVVAKSFCHLYVHTYIHTTYIHTCIYMYTYVYVICNMYRKIVIEHSLLKKSIYNLEKQLSRCDSTGLIMVMMI